MNTETASTTELKHYAESLLNIVGNLDAMAVFLTKKEPKTNASEVQKIESIQG